MRTSAWIYPWDIADLGVARTAALVRAGRLGAVNVAVSYHSLFATVPDNPRRHLVELPRSAVYHRPDPTCWAEIRTQPYVSPWLDEIGDALTLGRQLADVAGCELTAWTVCLHNDLGQRYPELSVRTVWGDRITAALCVRHPDVRAYARALVRDVGARADRVQLESAHWMPLPHHPHAKLAVRDPDTVARLTELCFCGYCRRAAESDGIDVAGLVDRLRDRWTRAYREPPASPLSEVDGLADYRKLRAHAVTSLVAELVEASPVPVEFVSFGDRVATGARLADIEKAGASVRLLAYGSATRVREVVATESLAEDRPDAPHLGLSLLPEHVPDEAAFRAAVAAARPARSLAFYHLGLVDAERRVWPAEVCDE